MKSIQQAMLEEIWMKAYTLAHGKQVTGEKNDYYITLEQLEAILKEFQG